MRKTLFPLLLLLLLSACSKQTTQIQTTTAPVYTGIDTEYNEAFLNASSVQLLFKEDQSVATFISKGNEYAAFTETTHWLSNHYVVVTIDNGGSIIHRYFYIKNNSIYYLQETIEEDNLLTLEQLTTLTIGEPILTAPFTVGMQVNDWHITAIDATLTTPLQVFTNVIVLEKTSVNETNKIYLAPGFGVIQNEFTVTLEDKEEKIISTLSSIAFD